MDGVRHPVGPEPAGTYWLRRAVVLAVLLALFVVLISLIVDAVHGPQTVAAAPAARASTGSASPVPSKAPAKPTAKPTATFTKKSPAPTVPACNPAQMKVALAGDTTPMPGRSTLFRLSMVNDGPARCQATVQAKHFELKIYSGTDRIWSSKDCTGSLQRISQSLGRGKAVDWRMTWNGRRSAPDCQVRPELPGAGTYVATAQLDGSRPAQLRLAITG